MELQSQGPEVIQSLERVLGYLNFSSGAEDTQFLSGLNQLFRVVEELRGDVATDLKSLRMESQLPTWRTVLRWLTEHLRKLEGESAAFKDASQAEAVLRILQDHFVRAYREYHSDLLFGQPEQQLIGPFMLGRMCESVLQQGGPWDEIERICGSAIAFLNDYVGHRPLPTIESRQIAPRPHEFVRPVPLFIAGCGVAQCRYRDVVQLALDILGNIDDQLAYVAYFDLSAMSELAVDPRPYDFEQPANKRPNYHFGEWDSDRIDLQGRYNRFVVRQVTLDSLMSRIHTQRDLPVDELRWEAASVLAGTILMASGISGSGPNTHDSNTTLNTLILRIAAYRDAFYEQLLISLRGPHRDRLQEEASILRQPFGGARQHLNREIATRRATELAHLKLANVFAAMGYLDAARRQTKSITVASARMMCQIDCHLKSCRQSIEVGNPQAAASDLEDVVTILNRGIECGAILDPWCILGFDGNFSLFPALENTVHDHRADELVDLMDRIFDEYARLLSDVAALDDQATALQVSSKFRELAEWWFQFAAHEVTSVDATNALESQAAAGVVAEALNQWHRAGAATGDVSFWSPHVESFDSPKAYALVVATLLDHQDFVSAMSLLVHWLGQTPRVALEAGQSSFHRLAQRWLCDLLTHAKEVQGLADFRGTPPAKSDVPIDWASNVRRFLDYLEANADEYWQVPQFEVDSGSRKSEDPSKSGRDDLATADSPPADEADEEDIYSAAYENVVFKDSTDDGVEGSIFDTEEHGTDQLEAESERIVDRLAFLDTVARLWQVAAKALATELLSKGTEDSVARDRLRGSLTGWCRQAMINRNEMIRLLKSIQQYRLPQPTAVHESLVQYDRSRLVKESLLEQVIAATIETSDALASTLAALGAVASHDDDHDTGSGTSDGGGADVTGQILQVVESITSEERDQLEETQVLAAAVLASALRDQPSYTEQMCENLMRMMDGQQILYVPLSKGGDPREILGARERQRIIENLLRWLPRLGMLTPARKLLDLAREMEHNVPVGSGAVTQFDELFDSACRAMVEALVRASFAESTIDQADQETKQKSPPGKQPIEKTTASQPFQKKKAIREDSESDLVNCLEPMTESLLISWLEHSRTLRLSVLEKVRRAQPWSQLVDFIQNYGEEMFSQRFLNLSNVRAILHQGVDRWLEQLEEDAGEELPIKLLRDLGGKLTRRDAVRYLSLILEAIVENYNEYRDYNSTTTQSDQGQNLYMLLDFLRLRTAYDRVMWNLKPILLAHEILVRHGLNEAAQMWRRALAERISEEADQYVKQLGELQKKYAMRLATVSDRINERFLRQMTIDRMRALVEPAIENRSQTGPHHAFELLEEESAFLMREPAGSGLDVPAWLEGLEEEMDRIEQRRQMGDGVRAGDFWLAKPTGLTLPQVRRQVDAWRRANEG